MRKLRIVDLRIKVCNLMVGPSPCKKCVVRACCIQQDKCNQLLVYIGNWYSYHDKIFRWTSFRGLKDKVKELFFNSILPP